MQRMIFVLDESEVAGAQLGVAGPLLELVLSKAVSLPPTRYQQGHYVAAYGEGRLNKRGSRAGATAGDEGQHKIQQLGIGFTWYKSTFSNALCAPCPLKQIFSSDSHARTLLRD